MKAARIDVGDLVPAQGRGDPGVGGRAHRVSTRDRPVAGVLAEVDEDADAVGHAPRGRRDALVAHPALDLLGEGLREHPHVREPQLGADRGPGCGGRSRPRSSGTREGRARPSPRARRGRSLARTATARRSSGRDRSGGSRGASISGTREVPGVEPRCSRGLRPTRAPSCVVDHGEDRRVPARKRDGNLVHVVGMLGGNALLVEELALDPVREPLQVERSAPPRWQRRRRDGEIVGDEIELRQAVGREETLCPGSKPEPRNGPQAHRQDSIPGRKLLRSGGDGDGMPISSAHVRRATRSGRE